MLKRLAAALCSALVLLFAAALVAQQPAPSPVTASAPAGCSIDLIAVPGNRSTTSRR